MFHQCNWLKISVCSVLLTLIEMPYSTLYVTESMGKLLRVGMCNLLISQFCFVKCVRPIYTK